MSQSVNEWAVNFNGAMTHLAGRSKRRSIPNTTASSPAERKEQGESGSRASWKWKKHKNTTHNCQAAQVPLSATAAIGLDWQTLEQFTHTLAHFVRCPFVLCYPLGILAALRGRELRHSDLTISGTHGQGGVSTVWQELGLCIMGVGENNYLLFLSTKYSSKS